MAIYDVIEFTETDLTRASIRLHEELLKHPSRRVYDVHMLNSQVYNVVYVKIRLLK